MTFFRKRCLVSILALVLTSFVFVSCSNGDDDDDSSSSNSSSNSNSSSSSAIPSTDILWEDFSAKIKDVATAFIKSPAEPTSASDIYTVFLDDAYGSPCYAWLDGTTVYYYPLPSYINAGYGKVIMHKDMNDMFRNFSKLERVDLSGIEIESVRTSLTWMFSGCSSLTSVTMFDTKLVSNMSSMFRGCSSLESLDLSSFNTSNVEDMSSMFEGCSSLESLDLSSFNTSNVKDMYEMFKDCSSLTSIDVSSFRIKDSYSSLQKMFYGCSKLETIYASSEADWSNVRYDESKNMFYGCESIKGGNGTTYASNKTSSTYARVDGLGGKAGYFTAK